MLLIYHRETIAGGCQEKAVDVLARTSSKELLVLEGPYEEPRNSYKQGRKTFACGILPKTEGRIDTYTLFERHENVNRNPQANKSKPHTAEQWLAGACQRLSGPEG